MALQLAGNISSETRKWESHSPIALFIQYLFTLRICSKWTQPALPEYKTNLIVLFAGHYYKSQHSLVSDKEYLHCISYKTKTSRLRITMNDTNQTPVSSTQHHMSYRSHVGGLTRNHKSKGYLSRPRWSRGNVLASRSKVPGFKYVWGRWIFSGRKNPKHKSSGKDFKLGVPSLRFQKLMPEKRASEQNFIGILTS